jgi:hypothetical protein
MDEVVVGRVVGGVLDVVVAGWVVEVVNTVVVVVGGLVVDVVDTVVVEPVPLG